MEEINPKNPPKPCQYFDMMGGTSTEGQALELMHPNSAYRTIGS